MVSNHCVFQVASNLGIATSFVDATDPSKVASAIKPNTRHSDLKLKITIGNCRINQNYFLVISFEIIIQHRKYPSIPFLYSICQNGVINFQKFKITFLMKESLKNCQKLKNSKKICKHLFIGLYYWRKSQNFSF